MNPATEEDICSIVAGEDGPLHRIAKLCALEWSSVKCVWGWNAIHAALILHSRLRLLLTKL